MNLFEILRSVDTKYETDVRIICNNWRKKVQEGIKEMMKFGMQRDFSIKFDVNEAYPENFSQIKFSYEDYVKYILFQNKNYLNNLESNLDKLPELINKVVSETNIPKNEIKKVKEFIIELLKKIPNKDELSKQIKHFNTDILGIYRIKNKKAPYYNSLFPNKSLENQEVSVEIFWAVIALFTERYNLNLEAATVTVLSHEYAHAYSHVGIDANKNHWRTDMFINTEPLIKEGIAEYFSFKFMSEYDNEYNKFLETYNRILEHSPEIYKYYKDWNKPSLEAVRFAMMETRNANEIEGYNYFLKKLEEGKRKYIEKK